MTCTVILLNENNNKVIKTLKISENTYPLCENRVTEMNKKVKKDNKYILTTINT